MKKRVEEVLLELIKNSKKSDRDIAKKLNISQPTVTRIRKKLEKNIIKRYTIIPGLVEMGIHIISFTFGKCASSKRNTELCFKQMLKNEPRIAFISIGEGMGKTCVIIGFHRDYKDYVNFLSNIRAQCKSVEKDFESFLAPTSKDQNLDFENPVISILKDSN